MVVEVTIERSTIKLSQYIDLVDLRIDAIADGNIYKSKLTCQGNRWLGTHLGEGIEACSCSASKDNRQNPFHAGQIPTLAEKNVEERRPFWLATGALRCKQLMIDMTMMQKFIDLGDLPRVQRDPPVPSRHCDAAL